MSPPPNVDRDGCLKYGHSEAETNSIATTGGGLSKVFDIQSQQLTVVSCASCSYSELYRGQSSGNLIDLFLG